MKICILSVCHNSYPEALIFLNSIYKSIKKTDADLVFFFIDNSSKIKANQVNLIKSFNLKFDLRYTKCENLGYYPSISFVIDKCKINLLEYDYVCLSNVDLQVNNDFFKNLLNIKNINSIGIYAPSIYSKVLSLDRNPKIYARPSSFKLKLNKFLYSSSITYALLQLINIMRLNVGKIIKSILKVSNKNFLPTQNNIYAPHGSFVILTKEFIKRIEKIDFPVFLFCEEIYLGEMANQHGLIVQYRPDLLVNDSEHVSTSLMESKDYRNFNVEALSFILNNYSF